MKSTFSLALLSLVLLCSLLLTSCQENFNILTEKDNGTTVNIANGEMFGLILEGNPTTGYDWIISNIDKSMVKEMGKPEFTLDSNLVGSPGKQSYLFQTFKAGNTTLSLEYKRAWEKGVSPAKTFKVILNIQ
ncbi:MAG: protease inhibitor I42 family protein [bacterium]